MAKPASADLQPSFALTIIKCKDIVPSPANNRSDRKADLDSLVASIEKVGLLQPPTVRLHPSKHGKYEAVCGERRINAFLALKREVIPCVVRDLSDVEAHEITVTENMQREDLSPLEEAAGIQTLLDDGRSLEGVADKLGKSVAWVRKRAKLADLSPRWRNAAMDADHTSGVSRWPAVNLELIARFGTNVQEQLYDDMIGNRGRDVAGTTTKDLQEKLKSLMRLLSSAPWKLDDATLYPHAGACSTCIKRTGNQTDLFEREADKKGNLVDRCIEPACWTEKIRVHVERREQELREKEDSLLLIDAGCIRGALPEDHPLKRAAVPEWKIQDCKKSTPGARKALVIDGPGAGGVRWVKPYGSSGRTAGEVQGAPKTLEELRKGLEKRRIIRVVEKIEVLLIDEIKKPDLLLKASPLVIMAAAVSHGVKASCNIPAIRSEDDSFDHDEWADYVALRSRDLDVEDLAIELGRGLLSVLQQQLSMSRNLIKGDPDDLEDARRVCEILETNLDAIIEAVRDEIKEPKSWAKRGEWNTKGLAKKGRPKGKKPQPAQEDDDDGVSDE